jgi:argininosuccinate lyase
MQRDPLREGRLGSERPEDVAAYLSSMAADRWIAGADIQVDVAHLMMLTRQEIIDPGLAKAIMEVLLEIHDGGLPATVYDDRYEDIHAGIEAYLIDRVGIDIGGRLHMGRSRNDEVATCIRVRLREELIACMGELLELREVLVTTAGQHTGTIMPGFTHLQHAQPTTLAHHLLSYEAAFGRDFDRMRDSIARINLCPLGAAAFASTGYPIDREYTASLLGFDGLAENTMDAVSGRDFVLEAISDCAMLMTAASRLCEEIVFWSSAFVAFIRLSDAYCSTSSIMPQKKNPDVAEIMRGKTGTVAGALSAGITLVKGLPMSYNRDLQELTPHLWSAVAATRSSVALLSGLLGAAAFNTDRMAEEADRGFATATELADVLVRDFGLPFRTAHGIVGRAVRKGRLDLATLEGAAGEIAGLSLVDLGVTDGVVSAALDAAYGIRVRRAPGGPAPEATERAIRERQRVLEADLIWVRTRTDRLEKALSDMIADARELIQ